MTGPAVLARDFLRRVRITLALRHSVVPWLTWLRAERPDVVVTNTAVIPTPAMASAASGVPHVWWVHEFVTRDHGFTYALGESLGQRVIGRLSRVVVVNSKAVKEHFSPPIRPEKVRLIYQGVVGFESEPSVIQLPDLRALGTQGPDIDQGRGPCTSGREYSQVREATSGPSASGAGSARRTKRSCADSPRTLASLIALRSATLR